MGDVTVVIACFEHGRYVAGAVSSARAQGARVLVVDDGSTTLLTRQALDRLEDTDVEVLREEHRGVCATRNAGLRRVETPYVLLLDADDRLAPNALALLRRPLERDPTLGFTYGHMRCVGEWRGVLRMRPYDPYSLLYRHKIGLSALMRRELAEDTGGFDPDFQQYEDWEFWINALAHGWHGQLVDAVVLEYRRHPGGSSKVNRDRRSYRPFYDQLRAKHATLYRKADELARESQLGPLDRLAHRSFWGPRPLPAGVEHAVQELVFSRGDRKR
jgi:glycosyltransferase involved in cell wall biosynthesis